jgi:hypothetical protein
LSSGTHARQGDRHPQFRIIDRTRLVRDQENGPLIHLQILYYRLKSFMHDPKAL